MGGGMADPAPVVSAVAAAPAVSTCRGRARATSRSGCSGARRRYGGGALTDTVKGTRWTGGEGSSTAARTPRGCATLKGQVTISESGHCPLLLSERPGTSTFTVSEIAPSTLISLSTSSETGPPTLSLSVEDCQNELQHCCLRQLSERSSNE